MLTRLFIRHIGLLKSAEIEPEKGFTVVTGETGAGKSMLMDALSIGLGHRADASLILAQPNGEKPQAQIDASFYVEEHPTLMALLEENDIPLEEGELILRRTMLPKDDGGTNSKAFANGVRVTAAQLRDIGECLADIHGQHEPQLLLNSQKHSEILDRFGRIKQERSAVKETYQSYKKAKTTLQEAQHKWQNQAREEAHLKSWLDELEALNYQQGEEVSLAEERLRLMSVEQTGEALSLAQQAFAPDDVSVPNVLDVLSQAERALNSVGEKGGEGISTLARRVAELYNEAQDISAEISRLCQDTQPDPQRLDDVDTRLNLLKDIARKHGIDVSELSDFCEKLALQYQSFSTLEEDIEMLEKAVHETKQKFQEACYALTALRAKVAQSLGVEVESVLKTLHMPNARFEAQLEKLQEEDWGAHGAERILFMISTNPGQSLQPLAKIASGGEMSRLMLALKVVFYQNMSPMTLVFDEIDTGLGGAVADAVADAMRALSKTHQVFAITHQPQVAAKGDAHLKIQKMSTETTAETVLTMLNDNQRQDELARMLSGKEITQEAQAAAEKMLQVARAS